MPQTVTFSALALLAVSGAASGVYLGKTAVAEIDPAHYAASASSVRFYADLVPGRSSDPFAPSAQVSTAGLGDGCVNCRTYPEEYVPQHDGSVDAYAAAYPAYEEMPAAQIMAEVDRQIAQIGRHSAVERYASYPIDQRDTRSVEVASVAPAVAASEPAVAAAPAAIVSEEAEPAETPGI